MGCVSVTFLEGEAAPTFGPSFPFPNIGLIPGSSLSSPCPPTHPPSRLGQAFVCLMNAHRVCLDGMDMETEDFDPFDSREAEGLNKCFTVVETIDEHSSIIHLFHRPLYLFPSWTTPRDFCLLRYWRLDDDGSYIVCYDSVIHPDCPPIDSHVRATLHGVFTISPRRQERSDQGGVEASFSGQRGFGPDGDLASHLDQGQSGRSAHSPLAAAHDSECLLTHIVQVSPLGWVPTSSAGYPQAFGVDALNHILDIRDTLDGDRFVDVGLDGEGKFKVRGTAPRGEGGDASGGEEGHRVAAILFLTPHYPRFDVLPLVILFFAGPGEGP